MPERWYVADIIGSGTDDDPYRPDLPIGLSWSANIPSVMAGPNRGKPRFAHCMVMVNASAGIHAMLRVRAKLDALLDLELGEAVTRTTRGQRAIIKAALETRGLSVDNGDGLTARDYLKHLGDQIGDVFDPDRMKVAE